MGKAYFIYSIIIVVISLSTGCESQNCTNDIQTIETKKVSYTKDDFYKSSLEFEATDSDLNNSLDSSLIQVITYLDTNNIQIDKLDSAYLGVKLILSRLYLYHLKKIRYGHNLKNMNKGSAWYIINTLTRLEGIDPKSEVINTGAAYMIYKDSTIINGKLLTQVFDSIDVEQSRIDKYWDDFFEKHPDVKRN